MGRAGRRVDKKSTSWYKVDSTVTDRAKLRKTISSAAEKHFGANKPVRIEKNNFVMDALFSEEERITGAKVQSRSIKAGNMLEDLANEIVEANPQTTRPAGALCGPGVKSSETEKIKEARLRPQDRKKTVVISRLPRERVNEAADRIKEGMRRAQKENKKRWTKAELLSAIEKERKALLQAPLDKEASIYITDLAWSDKDTLYLGELKTSGNLDSKNAPDEMRNLLKAVLAIGDHKKEVLPVAICSIKPTKPTSLAKIFPPETIWIGEEFWNRILPSGVSYDDMTKMISEILPRYR